MSKPLITVAVRELVEFSVRTGDLGSDRGFVGPRRALEGTRGHQRLQRSRPAGYQKEVPLAYDLVTDAFTLRIQGRIDGLMITGSEVFLEEIKTLQGKQAALADPLHWAQAKIYGRIYAAEHGLEEITLRLTYLHLDSGKITEHTERASFSALSAFFDQATAIYLQWVGERLEWCQQRDRTIRSLEFPFAGYRPGQRAFAVAAYRAISKGERLFLEAPTGVGKTISALFPAVKALAEAGLERIFYLTARTTARAIAEKAFSDLRRAGLRIRTLTLTAKEKVCVRAGQPCDPLLCPLTRGYFDRSKAAMRAALEQEEISRPVLDQMGNAHQVCPFELSLDLSSWVDAVVCDYNYVFDPKVYLRRHFAAEPRSYVFLVDEAHNLVDRARDMFSAELHSSDLRQVNRAVKTHAPRCAKALNKLSTGLGQLAAPEVVDSESEADLESVDELNLFSPVLESDAKSKPSLVHTPPPSVRRQGSEELRILAALPTELLALLQQALTEAETWLVQNEPAECRAELLELYFKLSAFARTAERCDLRYRVIVQGKAKTARIKLFCLDPSFLLGQALARGKAAVFFSATLSPMEYYRDLLGGRTEDPVLQLPSPFPVSNLAVLVQQRIRTYFKARAATIREVAEAVGALVMERAGNYLVFLPSYQYLTELQRTFRELYPQVTLLTQIPAMSEPERVAFLAAFAAESPPQSQVGFAVLGGAFGEGIDLVGDRLIGAAVVGVGLPPLSVERDLIRDYFDAQKGAGFDYAYLFPGMNRVLQATGRVIRSETDRGAVLLIDTRFAEIRYRRLFPKFWQPVSVNSAGEIAAVLRRFWPEKKVLL